jgi:hypothetical protein
MSERKVTFVGGVVEVWLFVFLAWILTYFVAGTPHWLQPLLFWLWVIPLIILALFFVLLIAVLVIADSW